MKKITLLASVLAFALNLSAQDDNGWKFKAGLGADFSQLFQFQPRVGSGQNRLGFGANAEFNADYHHNRLDIKNTAKALLGFQRFGSNKVLVNGVEKSNPFQKSVDQFLVRSNWSYGVKEGSKFSYWLGSELNTQLLTTYKNNLLKDTTATQAGPISKFFSPATFVAAPGLDYKPNKSLNVRFSPASVKMNIVMDDKLAKTPNDAGTAGVFGNPWTPTTYRNVDFQIGAFLNATYIKKFFPYKNGDKEAHRLIYSSNLNLFSNYIKDPKYVDVDWQNTIDLVIFKGLALSANLNVWYDHDFDVQKDLNNNPADGYEGTGKGVSVTQQLLIKYSLVF